jgi:multiple sugar transport system substrate-binding protein
MRNSDDFVAALQAMKDSTGNEYAAVASITVDPSTCWRLFMMTYSGLAGPIVEDLGTRVTIDRAAMEESFAFLQGLTGERLMPRTATSTTSSTLFSNGEVGFCSTVSGRSRRTGTSRASTSTSCPSPRSSPRAGRLR